VERQVLYQPFMLEKSVRFQKLHLDAHLPTLYCLEAQPGSEQKYE
jgi:hypothetical protein